VTPRKLSIAAKLYAIFGLMATATLALSMVAVLGARLHAARTDAFKSANAGSRNVERLNGLLYAEAVAARAVATAPDAAAAAKRADALDKINARIAAALSGWGLSVGNSDAADFRRLSVSIGELRDSATRLSQIVREQGPAAAVTQQGAATSEIARSVETAARRTNETAEKVNHVGTATEDTRTSAGQVKTVADDLGQAASRIRAQVDVFFQRLSA
jgi:methyl-accepting chemotaxis protein